MLLSEVHTRVGRDIADPNFIVVSKVDITDWANEAIRRIARQTGEDETVGTINLVAGTASYDLPASLIYIRKVENDDQIKLEQVEFEQFEKWGLDATVLGTPVYWYEFNEDIYFYPVPSEAATYTLYYSGLPSELATPTDDSTELPIPASYHDTVVMHCRMRANERLGDLNQAAFSDSQIERELMGDRQEANHPERDEFPAITGSSYDFVWD